ncbi:MAG: signal peptide peptidase SppA [Desulfosudaceae bacterium]
MFARRHPFLFFFLSLTGMTLVFVTIITLLVTWPSDKTAGFDRGEKVGVVEINGVIIESRQILQQLKTFRESAGIKAVVVRINSPGGAVGPSQEIYREIAKTIEKKKVVASLASVAASGGYYIASAANDIVANPGTITGSIGVIMSYTNLEELFEKLGLSPVVVKSGQYKDIASPMRTMKPDEKEILQAFAEDIHRQFVEDVATGRDMSVEEVSRLADGRIYTGSRARELGLIDRFGNLEDAIDLAGQLGGIEGKVTAVYPPKKDKFSLLELLLGSSAKNLVQQLIAGQGFSQGLSGNISGGYLYQPGR